ncbi:MAG: response regulator [Nitrospinales bacterium]
MTAYSKILIAEKNGIISMDLESNLEDLGHRVVRVASGKEAVDEALKNPPDLFLTNIALKGKMSGIEAAKQIRRYFEIPIIYIVPHVDEEMLKKAQIAGPSTYCFTLPFEDDELRAVVTAVLRKPNLG